MTNKVSVIIPVYNGQDFIARAIKSVLDQTIKPFELIVVNDGSTDRTAEKLVEFSDEIKVISIPNGGVSNARNVGIQASSGDFVAFLDADDIWYQDKLKLQLDAFSRFPMVGFSCCDYLYSDRHSETKKNHFLKFKNNEEIIFDEPLKTAAFAVLVKHNFVGTCSNVMIRREVLNQVGLFNVNYKQAEDYDLWLRCSLVTEFLLQSNILLEKKTHDANLTNNFLETLLFHEKVLMNLQSNNQAKAHIQNIKDEYQSGLALTRYEIGNLLYEASHRIKAFQYFFLGLAASYSLNNLKLFGYFFFRKLLRTISFGLIKNKQP